MAFEHYAIDEEFTIRGHWWRLEAQHRPAGDLPYTNHIELNRLRAFDDAEGSHPFEPELPDPTIILGESAAGTPISLLSSFYTNWKLVGHWLFGTTVPVTSS